MFFLLGLSGVFHVFLKNGHNIGVRATNLPKEAVSIACIIPVIPIPMHKADRIIGLPIFTRCNEQQKGINL